MDTAYYNRDLEAFKQALRTSDLETEYVVGNKTFKGKPLSSEYSIVGEGIFRGTPLVSLTAQSALGYDKALDFMQALLEAGTNPNHPSSKRGGLTPLGYLYQLEKKYPQFYSKFNYLESSLTYTIRMLLAFGADYEQYVDENPNAFTTKIIQDVLTDTRNIVFANKRFVPVSDYSEQHAKFCQELDKATNLTQLRVMAREWNIASKGLRKAELCDAIAQQIESVEAMSKDKTADAYKMYDEYDSDTN